MTFYFLSPPPSLSLLSSHSLSFPSSLLLPVHPDALPDYEGVVTSDPNCVVLADATDVYTYHSLNHAFRLLMQQQDKGRGTLVALGRG